MDEGSYFRLIPPCLIPQVASLIEPKAAWHGVYNSAHHVNEYPTYTILDPYAGDGDAILRFAASLFGSFLPAGCHDPSLPMDEGGYHPEFLQLNPEGASSFARMISGCRIAPLDTPGARRYNRRRAARGQ